MMLTKDIPLRDPFVVVDKTNNQYALFGTTDPEHTWDGQPVGFDVYVGNDLEHWDGPFPAFRPQPGFWSDRNYWAAEVHPWKDKWYMFASFKNETECRGTQILRADSLMGPYLPFTDRPVTPREWECLDGTFYADREGKPWIIFSHEWLQAHDGTIYALPLSDDLSTAIGAPMKLFSASESGWASSLTYEGIVGYITDGPFAYRGKSGNLYVTWASITPDYSEGYARSVSGELTGPWEHFPALFTDDGGHAMIFEALDGRLMLALHRPNTYMNEHPIFIEIVEENGQLRLKDEWKG